VRARCNCEVGKGSCVIRVYSLVEVIRSQIHRLGNNNHVYAFHKVTSMLFVAKAVLR
jgi:hypothetical protein